MRLAGDATEDIWWQVVRDCPYASFFHTPAWATIIESTYPGVARCARLIDLGGGDIAVLPAMRRYSRLRGRMHVIESMPPSTRGGPVCARALTRAEVDAIHKLATSNGVLSFSDFGNPLLEASWPDRSPVQSEYTHILKLSGVSHAEIFNGYSKGNRSSTRKGQRSDVEVRRERSAEAYDTYYELYLDSLRRWGEKATSSHPKELFDNICKSAGENAVLWL